MHVFTFLGLLALSCFGVASGHPHEDECGQFPGQEKGKPYVCTDDYKPVCGTNGVTYSNLCELCAARRETGKDIRVKHEGECKKQDECSKYPEPPKGKPAICTYEYAPVCGSDGVTYPNTCSFCAAKRESGKDITIKYPGECKKKDECSKYPEPPKGKPAICTYEYAPVCGSDGVTYPNTCSFCAAKRESGKNITIKYPGECKKKDECSKYPEPPKGKPAICTLEYAPVCGSDGVTYPNRCAFCAAKRESGKNITIKYPGECKKKDVCSKFPKPIVACTKEYYPVCGTNDVTYDNKCLLCLARQETGENIRIAYKGKCKEKDECSQYPEPPKGKPPACTREYNPLCGSDGVTYNNKCLYCFAKREKGGNLSIIHEGECKPEDECRKYPAPPKGKPILCTAEYAPVCGSDGVTYGNLCLFCDARREKGGDLTIIHKGECDQKNKKQDKE